MALTLLDTARQKKDPFEAKTVETFAFESDILTVVPQQTLGTTEVGNYRTNSIGTAGFRKRGEAYGAISGGARDKVIEAVYAMGGTIDIDKTDLRDKNATLEGANPLSVRTQEAVKAMAWTWNEAFVRGDHGTDEDSFEGIKVRLANAASSQLVYAVDASNDLDVYAAVEADLMTFLDRIDEAIYACDGHTADICLTTGDNIKAFNKAMRRLKIDKPNPPTEDPISPNQRGTSATKYTRPSIVYNGVRFFDMGLMADQTTKIIANDTIGGRACPPMYFLKLGFPYLTGIQQYAMEVSKPFMLPDGVTWRTVLDWPCGLRTVHPKFGSQLKGVAPTAS